MSEISYTYQITRVDPENKVMDIVYTSPTYGSITVGARMPWDGETVEDIVRSFSPVRYWLEQNLPVVPVQPGIGGSISVNVAPSQPAPRSVSKLALVRAMRDVEYGNQSLWAAAKAQLALADEDTKEDWEVASTISESDPVFVAMATTLYGADAPAAIKQLFDSAGAS